MDVPLACCISIAQCETPALIARQTACGMFTQQCWHAGESVRSFGHAKCSIELSYRKRQPSPPKKKTKTTKSKRRTVYVRRTLCTARLNSPPTLASCLTCQQASLGKCLGAPTAPMAGLEFRLRSTSQQQVPLSCDTHRRQQKAHISRAPSPRNETKKKNKHQNNCKICNAKHIAPSGRQSLGWGNISTL